MNLLDDQLRRLGLTPETMTNAEIRRELERAAEGDDGFSQTDPDKAPMPDEIDVDGTMRPTLNSKGQRIAATEDAVRNFWRWFGDSKVVDSDGRPLVVYHGTGSEFDSFDFTKLESGAGGAGTEAGFFFSTNMMNAKSYAAHLDPNGGGKIIEAYIKSDKAVVVDGIDEATNETM